MVARDYRVTTETDVTAGIYLQGNTEHSHGISSSLLSTTAVRAGQIVDSIVGSMVTEQALAMYVGSTG